MRPIPKLLSKTKLMRGYRCLKCIYLTIHHPEYEAPISAELQALFDQGNTIGEEARKYIPGGTLVNNTPWDFSGAIAKTKELIANGTQVIYEAAFEYMGCYARADILQFSPTTQRWRIIEVKSTTKAKPEHIDDVGLQTWIIAKTGLPIEQINIMHLNPECKYPDLGSLFKTVDVTAELRERYLSVQPKVADILNVIREKEIPNIDIGAHCLEPNDCGFVEHCWKEKSIPELSVLNLPGLHKRKWQLYHEGIIDITDPRLTDLNETQERIQCVTETGKRYINKEGIHTEISQWQFPLVFLDFETINPAIPRYLGRGPFQQVPFQFSVHRWNEPNAEITHNAFLHDSMDDPRPALIHALLEACGTEGSIVAYYGKFESERIAELADFAPEQSEALTKLIERIVDPLPIIRQNVYDKAFNGSFSLKSVAPALLGSEHSYKGMLIADGGAAQRAFEELINEKTSTAKKKIIYDAMLDYCNKDTLVMVELVKWLYTQTSCVFR